MSGLFKTPVIPFVLREVTRMAKYTLEEIMYGDKYGIESAVFAETFGIAQQGITAKEIKEQLKMFYVKHALLAAKKMHEEGDWFRITKLQSPFNIFKKKEAKSIYYKSLDN